MSFFPAHIQKRIGEFDDKQDIKVIVDNIKGESEDVGKILKQYNCSKESELISKMALELNYYELFIKKLNDLSFLLNLKMNSDLNDPSYQDTFSKFYLIKNVLEKLLEKINEANQNSINNSFTSDNKGKKDTNSGDTDLLNMTHIDQFFNYNSDNKAIQHIQKLLNESYNKISLDLEDLGYKHKEDSDKLPSNFYQNHEKIIQWELFLGKLLFDKDKNIDKLNKQVAELENYIKNSNKDQEPLIITGTGDKKSFSSSEDESTRIKSLLRTMEESKTKLIYR